MNCKLILVIKLGKLFEEIQLKYDGLDGKIFFFFIIIIYEK